VNRRFLAVCSTGLCLIVFLKQLSVTAELRESFRSLSFSFFSINACCYFFFVPLKVDDFPRGCQLGSVQL